MLGDFVIELLTSFIITVTHSSVRFILICVCACVCACACVSICVSCDYILRNNVKIIISMYIVERLRTSTYI